MNQITPIQLHTLLQQPQHNIQLVDVREADERALCHIGGEWIPLNQLPSHMDELDVSKPTVVYCRSGGRSAKACAILTQAGFMQVTNLEGGILRWQEDVDQSLPRY